MFLGLLTLSWSWPAISQEAKRTAVSSATNANRENKTETQQISSNKRIAASKSTKDPQDTTIKYQNIIAPNKRSAYTFPAKQ